MSGLTSGHWDQSEGAGAATASPRPTNPLYVVLPPARRTRFDSICHLSLWIVRYCMLGKEERIENSASDAVAGPDEQGAELAGECGNEAGGRDRRGDGGITAEPGRVTARPGSLLHQSLCDRRDVDACFACACTWALIGPSHSDQCRGRPGRARTRIVCIFLSIHLRSHTKEPELIERAVWAALETARPGGEAGEVARNKEALRDAVVSFRVGRGCRACARPKYRLRSRRRRRRPWRRLCGMALVECQAEHERVHLRGF